MTGSVAVMHHMTTSFVNLESYLLLIQQCFINILRTTNFMNYQYVIMLKSNRMQTTV